MSAVNTSPAAAGVLTDRSSSQAGSEWTLDYPPFFAYFERFMASFAYLVDPKIVQLDNLGYDAWSVIAFQRTTVILSELVLAGALLKCVKGMD